MNISLRAAHEVPGIYTDRLAHRMPGERAIATTMSVEFSNNPVLAGLVKYGRPEDILAVDYLGHREGAAVSLRGKKGHEAARQKFIDEFPGSYIILGAPENKGLLAGMTTHRSHIKALATGSRVLSLGGVNFTNYGYEMCVDAMFDFESQEFVDFLSSFIEQDGNLRDLDGSGTRFAMNEQSDVLVDYGKQRKSLIMDNVFADLMGKDIDSVIMSSTYIPAGYIYAALRNIADAGKSVTVYANALTKFRGPHTSLMERKFRREDLAFIALSRNVRRRKDMLQLVDCLPQDKLNHLKALLIRRKNHPDVAYIGSHNLHPISVGYGTAEIALRTTDETLIDQIEAFIADNLAPSEERQKVRLFGVRDILATIARL